MTFIQRATIALGLLCIPLGSALAAPSNITHVETHLENGILHVSWDAAQSDPGIEFYRVYFSHESILDHDGNYDDFDRTQGDETTFDFKALPLKSSKIFVAILGVNKDGIESGGFEAESSVDVPADAPPPEEHPADTPPPTPITIVEVHADSETGVLVLFSKQLSKTVPFTPEFFAITDLSGAALGIDSVEMRGDALLLHTQHQDATKEYLFVLLQPVPAEDDVKLEKLESPLHWMAFGHQDAPPPAENPPPEEQAAIPYAQNPAPEENVNPPEDAVDLALKVMRRKDGTYNVIAMWGASADSRHTLNSYVLSVSGNGETFEKNAVVAMNQTSVQYSHVLPGIFGVKVVARDAEGHESGGIQKVITLPQSGIGLLGITAVSGLIAGRRTQRKRKVVG